MAPAAPSPAAPQPHAGGEARRGKKRRRKKKRSKQDSNVAASAAELSRQAGQAVLQQPTAAAAAQTSLQAHHGTEDTTASSPYLNAAARSAARAAPAAAPPPQPEQQRRQPAKKRKRGERKTLSTRAKRAVVASTLGRLMAAGQEAAATQAPPTSRPAAAAAAPAAGGAAPADAADTRNLKRAWSREDLAVLARLVEDPGSVHELVPRHPPGPGLDWELLSRHFGRYSRGGAAVRNQYVVVARLAKEARKESKKGLSYRELCVQALGRLPDRQGSVYDIQAVLKRDFGKHLDKYKVHGASRWKAAVGEALRAADAPFDQVGKTPTGKILWRLRVDEAAAAGGGRQPAMGGGLATGLVPGS